MFLSTFAHQTFCPIPCFRKQRRTVFIWSQSPDGISSPSFQSQGYKNTWPKSHSNLSKCTAIALKMLPDSCFKSCDSLNVEGSLSPWKNTGIIRGHVSFAKDGVGLNLREFLQREIALWLFLVSERAGLLPCAIRSGAQIAVAT